MNTIINIQWIVPKGFSLWCFFLSLSLQPHFHVIYYNYGIISTIHVQIRFQEPLLVLSNPLQNLQLVTVRLLNHCSGITSTLIRLESQLGLMWNKQLLKIFVSSLCSSLIQYPTLCCDATLKNVQDDKTVLITSGLRLQDDVSPQTYFGLLYTIFISSSYTFLIITFI